MSGNQWLLSALLKHSTDNYFIEYRGFLSNHLAHGMIALSKLGASEARIEQFIDWYTKKLDAPVEADHPQHPIVIEEDQLIEYRGKRKAYYGILNHFQKQLKKYGSAELLIKNEFPKLSQGMVCCVAHGLIHVGYGYSVGSERIVVEGLAYLHHSYLPLKYDASKPENSLAKFGQGSVEFLDVLKELRQDKALRSLLIATPIEYQQGKFQFKMQELMNAGDRFIEYANKIKLPPSLAAEKDQQKLVVKISDWLVQQALFVYTTSALGNDFVLVHGVTSAWSLCQVVPLLAVEDAFVALRTYACILMAVFVIQECPELCEKIPACPIIDENVWAEIVKEALSRDFDEHVFKLVQVAHGMWLENKEDADISVMCVAGSRRVIAGELTFIKYE